MARVADPISPKPTVDANQKLGSMERRRKIGKLSKGWFNFTRSHWLSVYYELNGLSLRLGLLSGIEMDPSHWNPKGSCYIQVTTVIDSGRRAVWYWQALVTAHR